MLWKSDGVLTVQKNMSFVIPAGTTAALAGKSGSQTCHQNTGKEI
jgi:hypothetical protein